MNMTSFKWLRNMKILQSNIKGILEARKSSDIFKSYLLCQLGNSQKVQFNQNTFIRLNRTISKETQEKIGNYSFWSEDQVNKVTSRSNMDNSFISNPFKTHKLIQTAIMGGISKMVVQDIEELEKIKLVNFTLRKQNLKKSLITPKILWAVQNTEKDLKNIQNLSSCKIEIDGLYFRREYSLGQIKMFLPRLRDLNLSLKYKIKEASLQQFRENQYQLEELGIQTEICDYSESDSFLMAARILGKDRRGTNIFSDECYPFLCSKALCCCPLEAKQIGEQFLVGDQKWQFLKPARVDTIVPDVILRQQEEQIFVQES